MWFCERRIKVNNDTICNHIFKDNLSKRLGMEIWHCLTVRSAIGVRNFDYVGYTPVYLRLEWPGHTYNSHVLEQKKLYTNSGGLL